MCRWAAWIGEPIYMEELVTLPDHSLIHQSHAASECKTATNGDGFGLAWYGDKPMPGQYRDVLPAWADANLRAIAGQVKARTFLAHVRASTGAAVSRNNCHPFVSGKWSFMHNGQIGGFDAVRRRAEMLIPDALYPERKGATDSEALFLLALAEGFDHDPAAAISRALAQLGALATAGGGGLLRVSAALSDGHSLWAFRYASDQFAPTLYYRWDDVRGGWIVASEPLDNHAGWVSLEPGTVAHFSGKEMGQAPFGPAPDLVAAE